MKFHDYLYKYIGYEGFKDIDFKNDVVVTLLPCTPYLKLMLRGVKCYPDREALSLWIFKDKQTELYGKTHMIKHTHFIRSFDDLNMDIKGRVVTKENHSFCGDGIRLWEDVHELRCNPDIVGSGLVVQPYLEGCRDVRVILIGDYVESYERINEHDFRKNIERGGTIKTYVLNDKELSFCREVLEISKFPFAHIDILVSPTGEIYLLELMLNGGIQGSKLTTEEIGELKVDILKKMLL